MNINGQESRFQIWDTAGQARFRALIPSYLGGAHVAIIVYDLTNSTSFENIPEWIDLVQKCGEKFSLVVLLGNKLDLEDKRYSIIIIIYLFIYICTTLFIFNGGISGGVVIPKYGAASLFSLACCILF